jgi:predicted dehydrogenase
MAGSVASIMTNDSEFSRRDFLKTATVLAAGLPWLSLLQCARDPKIVSPNDRVCLGVIGIGSRGTKLLMHLQTIPGTEISAVCDDYKPHLFEGQRLTQGRAKRFQDYRELLARPDIDGVVIATPLHLHAAMSKVAMAAGKQVFCEKCMGLTIAECQEMMRFQKQTGRILQIGFQRLFDVRYIEAMELIARGAIGRLTCMKAHWHRNNNWRLPLRDPALEKRVNWRLYTEFSGGIMTELASHQIQVANWAAGQPPAAVMGTGGIDFWKDGREVYDNVSVIFSYPGGIKLSYTGILTNRHYGAQEQIMGTEATIELEKGKVYQETPPPSPGIYQLVRQIEEKVFATIPIGGASWIPEDPSRDRGDFIIDKMHIPSATQLELEAFIGGIRTQRMEPALLNQAYGASVAALLGNQAMAGQNPVRWPGEVSS